MNKISSETVDFIKEHLKDNVQVLALQSRKYPSVDMSEAVTQISGWQIASKKIPSWASVNGILYPKHLSMEQCSSEVTAVYKSGLVNGETFADITAGFGVDCSFISRKFNKAYYVERQEYLCDLAKNNFGLLGLDNIEVCNEDGTDFLKRIGNVDCIFVDPARRDANGGKTVLIADCEPDVCSLEETLLSKADIVMIKLSPMLDIHSAMKELKHISSIHVVSVNNECKELVIILTRDSAGDNVSMVCHQISNTENAQTFIFGYDEESKAVCKLADAVGKYLYEPGAALLKAGPYKLLGQRFNVRKLHINSHLYTSDVLTDFPGRKFEVIEVSGFGKKELKSFMSDIVKANLTVRNFPASVAELRKRLKLKEGGEIYLFATTLSNGEKVIIKCRSVKSFFVS